MVGFFALENNNDRGSRSHEAPNNGSSETHVHTGISKDKFRAPGNVPAFIMAVNDINSNKTILGKYKLQYYVNNDACESDLLMAQFIFFIREFTKKHKLKNTIGIVGPTCSDTLVPLAGVQKHYKIPVISYGAEGAILSDQEKYPFFFRTIPENKIYSDVFAELFMKLGWKRIASITEEGQRYSEYVTPMRELLERKGMVFLMRKYRVDPKSLNLQSHLHVFRDGRSTVIIGDFYEDIARHIMCLAYHSKMTARQGYVWFLPKWYSRNWYESILESTEEFEGCTVEQMRDALEGHMSLSYQYFGEDNQITPNSTSVAQWNEAYERMVTAMNTTKSEYAGFTYDAVWSYALALDKMARDPDRSLMVDLRSDKSAAAIIKNLESLRFNGVSGEISFQSSHSRVTDIVVVQFRNRTYVEVGKYKVYADNASLNSLDMDLSKLVWPGETPVDKLEPCVVEGFRDLLGASCTTSIVLLCFILFGIAILFPIICVFILKQNYDRKVKELQALWSECNIYNMFTGCQIKREDLVLNRRLGEGQFGLIYGGECNLEGHGWIAVAVKTLKPSSSIAEKRDFLSEADLMRTLQHENIVKLIGVCTDSEPMLAVMEFMLYG